MLHAKIMTVDGIVANIGSANLNAGRRRSTRRSTSSRSIATLTEMLDGQFDDDLAAAFGWNRGGGNDRSPIQRVVEAAVTPIKRFF